MELNLKKLKHAETLEEKDIPDIRGNFLTEVYPSGQIYLPSYMNSKSLTIFPVTI